MAGFLPVRYRPGDISIKRIYPPCGRLDLHKKFAVACSHYTTAAGAPVQGPRRFSTMTARLKRSAA
jgi:hypothetical protein